MYVCYTKQIVDMRVYMCWPDGGETVSLGESDVNDWEESSSDGIKGHVSEDICFDQVWRWM